MSSSRQSEHYIPTLDGWRAVAIGLVMASHATDAFRSWLAGFGIAYAFPIDLGTLGVQIFFALSGFLITTKMLDSEARGGFSMREFYVRRVFRILPASMLFLALMGLLALAGVFDFTLGRWLSTVFFLANYSPATPSWYLGHFWSLAVEEHFYLLWPLAFVTLRSSRHRLVAVCAMFLGVALWRAIAFKLFVPGFDPAIFWGRTDIVADALMGGVAVSLAWRDETWRPRLLRLLANPLAAWVLVVVVAVVDAARPADWKLGFVLLSVKFALLPLAILATVVRPRGVPARVLEWSVLRWIGLVSYSLYLYQQVFLVHDEFTVPRLHLLQSAPLNVAFALLAGWASYRLVETPMIKVGQRVLKGMKGRSQAAAA